MKRLLIIVFMFVALNTFAESKMNFKVYGIEEEVTQKYQGLFEIPRFEYMGGFVGGNYVYVVTLITAINNIDYYCVGIVTDSWFNDIVVAEGYMVATVYDKKRVRLSYRSIVLIKIPFKVE